MARIGRISVSGKPVDVAFHDGECFSIGELLRRDASEVRKHIFQIGMTEGRNIEDAIHDNISDPLSPGEILVPVEPVHTIRDFYAFEEHVKAGRRNRGLDMIPEWYEIPVFYYSGISSLYGSGIGIPYPEYSNQLDFELELAFVIGKSGINIKREEAMEHIMGITIANDWSARDEQMREMKLNLGPAKGKDFATSLGPAVMTLDSLLSRRETTGKFNIHMEARVNGRKYSDGNLNTIYHNIDAMVERASMGTMLHPGDILMTGTVGTGCILELGADRYGWLKRGDRVEMEAEGIGILANTVI